jgi:Sulfotransferase family
MASDLVFLVGTGRCGSSLLHELLAQHEDVGFLSNVEDRLLAPPIAGRWNGQIYRSLPPSFTAKGRLRFAPSEGYRILERRVSPLLCRPFPDLTEADATPWLSRRLRAFFGGRAAMQGRPTFLHKFTGWPRARLLHAVFPEARFVHVIRDGRAVAASLVRMPWWQGHRGPDAWDWGPLGDDDRRAWEGSGRSFPVLAGLEWKILMETFDEAGAAIPPERWLDVRFEDLLHDPTTKTKEVLGFIGLPWTSAFERRFDRYRFDAGAGVRYREELAAEDLASLDVALAAPLSAWGYHGGGGDRHGRERAS